MTPRMRRASTGRGWPAQCVEHGVLDDASCLFTAGQDRLSRSDRAGTTSRNHEQRLQHERRGVRFTPGHGREPAGSLSCRTITQQGERGTAVHPFRHAILLGSAPPPAQGVQGSLRRGGVRRGLERRHQGEYTNVLPSNVRAPDMSPQCPVGEVTENSRWGQRRVAVCPLVGCGSPEGSPAKAALVRLGAEPGTCRPAAGGSGRRLG